ncbi:hypothetical protein [Bradyrhizobium ivorense]|nr:hypothetical protein [Bradyrhizobium ivorense]
MTLLSVSKRPAIDADLRVAVPPRLVMIKKVGAANSHAIKFAIKNA